MRGDSSGGNAVLSGAGFRNDARLAHFYGEQTLADGVIYLVSAGMQQIFALEVNTRAAEMRGEARSELQRRGTACEISQQIGEFRLELRVGFRGFIGALEFEERPHQRFGYVASTVGSETSGSKCCRVKCGTHGAGCPVGGAFSCSSVRRTSSTNSFSRA